MSDSSESDVSTSSSEDEKQQVAKRRSKPSRKDPETSSDETESSSDESDEDDEEEDDDADLATPKVTSKILDTLAKIRSKDPSIYKQDERFFSSGSDDSGDETAPRKREKRLTLPEYKREFMLQREGHIASDSEDDDVVPIVTHEQEQRQLKDAFISAAAGVADSEDEDEISEKGLLRLRERSDAEKKRENDEAMSLRRQREAASADTDIIGRLLSSQAADPVDQFLQDYVANERWRDKKSKEAPTYNEILGTVDEKQDREDRRALEDMEEFEHKYNFRFEEEGGVNIIGHTREVPGSVRKEKEARKESRRRKQEAEEIARTKRHDERNQALAAVVKELEAPTCKLTEAEKKQRYLEAFVESLDTENEAESSEGSAADDVIRPRVKLPFGYTAVKPNTYGMTVRDILRADDAELDEYVPVKSLAPYREKEWKPMYDKKPFSGKNRKSTNADRRPRGGGSIMPAEDGDGDDAAAAAAPATASTASVKSGKDRKQQKEQQQREGKEVQQMQEQQPVVQKRQPQYQQTSHRGAKRHARG